MKNAILFDLDGTLWDSTEQLVIAWNHVLDRHQELNTQLTLSDIQGIMGKTVSGIASALLPCISTEMGVEIINECFEEETLYLQKYGGLLYPKLEETLTVLKKHYKLFIVSNCQDGYIQTFLDYHQLRNYFDDFESFGKTGKVKGENIKSVILRNHIEKAVFVGDTQSDLDAADLADVPFIYASYGFGQINRKEIKVNTFSEIIEAAKSLFEDR